jgi:hypothetical protein
VNVYRAVPAFFPANAASDLQPLPGESFMSSVWRLAWRNGLSKKELKGVHDPGGFTNLSGWGEQSREMKFVGASNAKHRSAWWDSSFRYCPLCLEHLYHSFWHQSMFLSHCPLDGAELRTDCYCCGTRLSTIKFHRSVFTKPYTCPKCDGPISGIKVSLGLRLAIQQRASEFEPVFATIERWWTLVTPVRKEVENLLPSRSGCHYAPWLRLDTSARQWVLASAPTPEGMSTVTRTLPQLIVLSWRVRLEPDRMTRNWSHGTRRPVRLALALQAYRSTLRRLWKAISRRFSLDEVEYRRHLTLPPNDLVRLPERSSLHLLALIVLRKSYETYYSIFQAPEKADFDDWLVDFPYGNEFAERVRICWRAQFIAEYASIFWGLMAVRDGRCSMRDLRKEVLTLHSVSTKLDFKNGDLVSGSVAFPAVDGLTLGLFV